jgi:hypothetical protein
MIIHNKEHHLKTLEGRSYRAQIFNQASIWSKDLPEPVAVSHVVNKVQGRLYFNSVERGKFLEQWHSMRKKLTYGVQRNAATGYDMAALLPFVAVTMLDIQRLADDMSDHSATLYNVISRPDATKKVSLVDLLPFVGRAGEFGGTRDLPPIMQHNLGVTEDVIIKLFGFGDLTALNEILWSPNYDQIAVSAARIIADERNKVLFAPMVGATYDAAHSVPLSTAGEGPDENIYLTIKNAYKKLIRLVNPLTGSKIYDESPEIALYVNKANSIDLKPIVEGDLRTAGGLRMIANALPVDNYVEYSGGLNHNRSYMGGNLEYPGVPEDVAFMAAKIPDGAQLIKKIDWNMEVQPASSRVKGEEKYWWTAFGVYNENVLPASANGTAYGAIVKIALTAA